MQCATVGITSSTASSMFDQQHRINVKNEVEDFTPVMQRLFQKYLVAMADLSSIGDGKSATDFSMLVMS